MIEIQFARKRTYVLYLFSYINHKFSTRSRWSHTTTPYSYASRIASLVSSIFFVGWVVVYVFFVGHRLTIDKVYLQVFVCTNPPTSSSYLVETTSLVREGREQIDSKRWHISQPRCLLIRGRGPLWGRGLWAYYPAKIISLSSSVNSNESKNISSIT